jgi:hypothetical protein
MKIGLNEYSVTYSFLWLYSIFEKIPIMRIVVAEYYEFYCKYL